MNKIIKIKSGILCSLFLFFSLFTQVSKMSNIEEYSKPFLGKYECREFFSGNKNKIDEYDFIYLNIEPKNKLRLIAKKKEGKTTENICEYSYDENKCLLTIYGSKYPFLKKKSYLIENGKINIKINFAGKLFAFNFYKKLK